MIKQMLSKADAEEIFSRECCLMFGSDAIPEYRCYELFGEAAAEYVERNLHIEGLLVGGRDWNAAGSCSEGRPLMRYFLKAGFMQLVTENNYLLMVGAYKESKGGKIADHYKQIREERLAAEEAAEEAKRAERKAKRAAAKAARDAKTESEGK